MQAYDDPAEYGREVGLDYDVLYPEDGLDTARAVDFLAELALAHPQRSLVEFGIGTGRLAVDLHRRGVRVAGVDASEEMIAALRRKAPGVDIPVAVGDYITTRVEGCFAVVAIVFNNVLDSRGLPAQLALFQNAARHLVPGGSFVVEAYVLPDSARDGGWSVTPRYVGQEHVELQMSRFDPGTGVVERTLVHLRPEGPRFVSVRDVYSGPDELDVLARASGFECTARYSGWDRAPFTGRSRHHVSVYRRC